MINILIIQYTFHVIYYFNNSALVDDNGRYFDIKKTHRLFNRKTIFALDHLNINYD